MNINKVTVPTLKAEITIGLNKGYSEEFWSVIELKNKLAAAQQKLKQRDGILLSTKVTLSFINYPKFPIEKESFKNGVSFIAKELMNELSQNRIVVVFNDETIMLEDLPEIDGSINIESFYLILFLNI
ncbi:hypothetical protein GCM10023314_01590 [Algibacter agarivorans]|uniref:Uncharacterized protein n=1 Tax=Algibacter agarivorans TaxID=1109741 RepID=A0ABP9G8L9_9FLAO